MIKVAIIGSGFDKFTPPTERLARDSIIRILKRHRPCILVSGRSPVGGIDIWAEEIANKMRVQTDIKAPRVNDWNAPGGFKDRNIEIARDADVVYVIVVGDYPPNYRGRRFDLCYHCAGREGRPPEHAKSGGCWTGWRAKDMGKQVNWVIISKN